MSYVCYRDTGKLPLSPPHPPSAVPAVVVASLHLSTHAFPQRVLDLVPRDNTDTFRGARCSKRSFLHGHAHDTGLYAAFIDGHDARAFIGGSGRVRGGGGGAFLLHFFVFFVQFTVAAVGVGGVPAEEKFEGKARECAFGVADRCGGDSCTAGHWMALVLLAACLVVVKRGRRLRAAASVFFFFLLVLPCGSW